MDENKQSLKKTLQLIIDILRLESSDVDLKHQLESTTINWDSVVIVASKHLVLPAVYCRLQQKELLAYIPRDLKLYLEKLTQLNRERNQTLLREAEQISKLLNSNHINHVFVKGVALLAGNYFKDIGERMVGDIDILVDSTDVDKAFDVLVEDGYSQFVEFNYEVKNYRHRPRQISEECIGAVEIHDQLLADGYNHLINKKVLLSQKEISNNIAIPNSQDLIWNTILAQQINDKSYYYNALKLKGIYDVLAVGLSEEKELIKSLSENKYGLGFLSLASIFCPTLKPSKETINTHLKKQIFLFSLKYSKFGTLIFKMKTGYIGSTERIKLIFQNKSYRKHIIKNKLIK